jgi:hypothetical protein
MLALSSQCVDLQAASGCAAGVTVVASKSVIEVLTAQSRFLARIYLPA